MTTEQDNKAQTCTDSCQCGYRPQKGYIMSLIGSRDRPKPMSLVSAIAETVAETRDTYTAVTES